jgi:hypothetical protein
LFCPGESLQIHKYALFLYLTRNAVLIGIASVKGKDERKKLRVLKNLNG